MIRLFAYAACVATLVIGISLADENDGFDAQQIADGYSAAVNGRDLEAVLSFWSNDAELVFLPGGEGHTISGHAGLRSFYEEVFSSDHHETLSITVTGMEVEGDLIREWGSYEIGSEVKGCYVILRRKSDDWKVYREWLVEPCGA